MQCIDWRPVWVERPVVKVKNLKEETPIVNMPELWRMSSWMIPYVLRLPHKAVRAALAFNSSVTQGVSAPVSPQVKALLSSTLWVLLVYHTELSPCALKLLERNDWWDRTAPGMKQKYLRFDCHSIILLTRSHLLQWLSDIRMENYFHLLFTSIISSVIFAQW